MALKTSMLSHRFILKVLLLSGLLLTTCNIAATGVKQQEVHLPALDNTQPLVKATIKKAYQDLISGKQSADDWGEYGKQLYANRMRAEAVLAFQNARSLDPENYVWPYLLAEMSLLDSSDKTITYIQAAYKLQPSSLDVCYLLAESYAAVGDLDRAISAIAKAYELAPDNLHTNYYYAQLLMSDRQYAASKKYMLKAAQLAPTSSRIRARLLQIAKYTDIDKSLIPPASQATDDSDIVYTSKIKAEALTRSRLPDIMGEVARMYLRNHQWRKAEKTLSLLNQHYTMTAEKKSVYALVLTKLHQYEKADNLYNELIQEYPDNIEYRLGLANLLYINHKPEAYAHYQWVLEHADTDDIKSRTLQKLGRIAASEGDLSRSRDLLQQALKINSKSAEIHRDMIMTYVRLKQFDQALKQLEDAQKLGIRIPNQLKYQLEQSRRTSNVVR